MNIITLLLLLVLVMGVVLGVISSFLFTKLRRFGTTLVLELDPSTDGYALTYRRPNNKFMEIKRGKEKATVALEEAQIWSPNRSMDAAIDGARIWQKRGGNAKMKMVIVDGDTGLPLKKFDGQGARNIWPNGYDMKRILEAPLVREFVQKDTDNSRMMMIVIMVLGLCSLAAIVYLMVQVSHLVVSAAASQTAGAGHA